jgi:hypothetical protein
LVAVGCCKELGVLGFGFGYEMQDGGNLLRRVYGHRDRVGRSTG